MSTFNRAERVEHNKFVGGLALQTVKQQANSKPIATYRETNDTNREVYAIALPANTWAIIDCDIHEIDWSVGIYYSPANWEDDKKDAIQYAKRRNQTTMVP
jgi:hypothetical protein